MAADIARQGAGIGVIAAARRGADEERYLLTGKEIPAGLGLRVSIDPHRQNEGGEKASIRSHVMHLYRAEDGSLPPALTMQPTCHSPKRPQRSSNQDHAIRYQSHSSCAAIS